MIKAHESVEPERADSLVRLSECRSENEHSTQKFECLANPPQRWMTLSQPRGAALRSETETKPCTGLYPVNA